MNQESSNQSKRYMPSQPKLSPPKSKSISSRKINLKINLHNASIESKPSKEREILEEDDDLSSDKSSEIKRNSVGYSHMRSTGQNW